MKVETSSSTVPEHVNALVLTKNGLVYGDCNGKLYMNGKVIDLVNPISKIISSRLKTFDLVVGDSKGLAIFRNGTLLIQSALSPISALATTFLAEILCGDTLGVLTCIDSFAAVKWRRRISPHLINVILPVEIVVEGVTWIFTIVCSGCNMYLLAESTITKTISMPCVINSVYNASFRYVRGILSAKMTFYSAEMMDLFIF